MRKSIYFVIPIGLILVVAVSVIFILNSAPGSRWLLRSAIDRVFKDARLETVAGRIFSGVSVKGLYINEDGIALQLKNITFKIQPRSLLAGTITLENLSVESAHIVNTGAEQQEALTKAMAEHLAQIPIAFACENASIGSLSIQLNDFKRDLNSLHFSVKLEGDQFSLSHMDAKDQSMDVALQGSVSLTQPNPFKGSIKWRAHTRGGRILRGEAQLEGDRNEVTLEHRLFEPHWVKTSGQLIIMRSNPELPPASNAGDGAAPSRKQSLDRKNAEYKIDFKGIVDGQGFPPLVVQIQGQADSSGIMLDNVVADTLEGVVHANGRIDLENSLSWNLNVEAMNLNPGCYWANWDGNIALKANIGGELNEEGVKLREPTINITGDLLGKPFMADGVFMLEDKSAVIERLEIRSGESSLSIKGQIMPNMDIDFRLAAKDPDHLWPGLKGRFIGAGGIKGNWEDLSTTFELSGSQVAYKTKYYGSYDIQSLNMDWKAEFGTAMHAENLIKMDHLKIGETFPIDHYEMASKGSLDHHSLLISLKSDQINFSTALKNDYNRDEETIKIQIDALSLEASGSRKWKLNHPTDMLVSHFEVKPVSGCLERNGSTTCLEGSWKSETGWDIKGDLAKAPIPSLNHVLNSLREEIPAFQQKTTALANDSAVNIGSY